jgi:hypothetical protein
MGIRGVLMRAVGAFVVTTVSFAAAIVIAHSLLIPDPVGRILSIRRDDVPHRSAGEGGPDTVVPATGAPQTIDEVAVPEVTAEPAPRDMAGGDRAPAADAAEHDAPAIDQPRAAAADDGGHGGRSGPYGASSQHRTDSSDRLQPEIEQDAIPPSWPQPTRGDDAATAATSERLQWPWIPQPTQSPSPEYETPPTRTLPDDHGPPLANHYGDPYGDRHRRSLRDVFRWRDDRRARWDLLRPGSAASAP